MLVKSHAFFHVVRVCVCAFVLARACVRVRVCARARACEVARGVHDKTMKIEREDRKRVMERVFMIKQIEKIERE